MKSAPWAIGGVIDGGRGGKGADAIITEDHVTLLARRKALDNIRTTRQKDSDQSGPINVISDSSSSYPFPQSKPVKVVRLAFHRTRRLSPRQPTAD